MCGFSGILDSRGLPAQATRGTLHAMAESLRHRGPDAEGIWLDPEAGIGFAFRRLAIQDLSDAGNQPMASPSERFTLVFNGEIYNVVDLRRHLRAARIRFAGHSDTEVLAAGLDRWGLEQTVRRIVGMFAIAVWDAERRLLHLVRDRLGIKPLYYQRTTGGVVFGSELRAMRVAPSFRTEIDPVSVAEYLRYLYVPGPRSIFRDAWKLPPGTILTFSTDQGGPREPKPFWSLLDAAASGIANPFRGDEEEAATVLEDLLDEAVRGRMIADVPLGALLSGGIDSSTVAALMQRASSPPIRTFTVGFDVSEHDESAHAGRVARYLGTDHTELTLGGRDALEVVPCLPEIFDEPHADPSQIPTHLISRLARRDVTVALSGDGGDELFAGYNRYVHGAALIRRASAVPSALRRSVGSALAALPSRRWDRVFHAVSPLLPAGFRHRLPGEKIHKLGRVFMATDVGQMYRSLHSMWDDPIRLLRAPTRDPGPWAAWEATAGWDDLLSRMLFADQSVYLPDDLLAKVDRASMAVSLEVRVPILDHRIVEFAWSLSRSHRIRGGEGKWLLRSVLHRLVPAELVERPKVGFTAPIGSWLEGSLEGWALDQVATVESDSAGLLDPDALRDAWTSFREGRSEMATGLWAALLFRAWRTHHGV